MKLKDFLTLEEQKQILKISKDNLLNYEIKGDNISNTLTEDQQLQKIEDWCIKK